MKSIQQQFEHVVNMWQMNPDFPIAGNGIDALYASGVLSTIDGGTTWVETTASAGRLMLAVLSGIAEFERDLILQRTNEGRARAMAEGTRFGRRPKLTKHQAREALKRVAAGGTLREIALSYNVDYSTIHRFKARYAAET
jgi:DNA invertase Pin-like site-specific DNA recombinase